MDKQFKKVWYIHANEYYSVMKKVQTIGTNNPLA
jgi:hypothetical protein